MLELKEILKLKIETMSYGQEGIAKHNGIAVFVKDVVEGDVIEAEVISVKKNLAKAKLINIIEPSPHRVEPFCGLAKICGGCQWQHIDYDYQVEAKRQAVIDCVDKIGKIKTEIKETLKSPEQQHFRCKVQLPIQQTKVSKRFLAGYYKKGTHDLVNVKYCPIAPNIIDEITERFRELALEMGLSAYNELKHKGLIRHMVFRYSQSEKDLNIIFVVNEKRVINPLKSLSYKLMEEFDCIKGICANFNTSKGNMILGQETVLIEGEGKDYIFETIGEKRYKISAGSFFQVNIGAAKNMLDTVKTIVTDNFKEPEILDVYAGVGSFSMYLSDVAKSITAVEEYTQAVEDAVVNKEINNADNVDILQGDAKEALAYLATEKKNYDVVLLDPPRKGCTKEALDAVCDIAKDMIIYVSCNPSTLARDLAILKEKGFNTEFIQPVDMFCHTYHIESIAVLKR